MLLENRFRQAKEQRGFTNQEIATRTGLSYATVARMCAEGGNQVPFSSDTLEKLCNCFQLQPQALLVLRHERLEDHESDDAEPEGSEYEQACALAVDFIAACCFPGTGRRIRKLVLWFAYQQWCAARTAQGKTTATLPHRAFDQWLRDFLGLTDKRSTGGHHIWEGIELRAAPVSLEDAHLQAA